MGLGCCAVINREKGAWRHCVQFELERQVEDHSVVSALVGDGGDG